MREVWAPLFRHYYNDMSVFEKLNDQSCNAQNRRSSEM